MPSNRLVIVVLFILHIITSCIYFALQAKKNLNLTCFLRLQMTLIKNIKGDYPHKSACVKKYKVLKHFILSFYEKLVTQFHFQL